MNDVARVMLYTEQALLAYGMRRLIEGHPSARLAVICGSASKLIETGRAFDPDIILLDQTQGILLSALADLVKAVPRSKIIVISPDPSKEASVLLHGLGAFGVVAQGCSPEQFLASIGLAAAGAAPFTVAGTETHASSQAVPLSPRQEQLIALIAQGLKNKEIGKCLGISEGTVKVYLSKLFQKLGANDRLDLALYGLRNNLHLSTQPPWIGSESSEPSATAIVRCPLQPGVIFGPRTRPVYAVR